MRYFQDRMKRSENNGLASGSVLKDDPEIKRRQERRIIYWPLWENLYIASLLDGFFRPALDPPVAGGQEAGQPDIIAARLLQGLGQNVTVLGHVVNPVLQDRGNQTHLGRHRQVLGLRGGLEQLVSFEREKWE